ncbi:ABC transporter ATP-binding protein [Helicobacter sp. MIT 05-5293]|uniref:ABC transporter ATP-binding protein n=1 Tax=Helicobacter sp. MIT 05-5293 TaxID=1548149 RepID=UPI00051D9C29|nr:ABC transporter ATP-binding protein [Helicobacter sp. MIT 05-5293]TLD81021.1 ABC transporter ATP-binding protein [Helicobacter sp. MIT 05-5293]
MRLIIDFFRKFLPYMVGHRVSFAIAITASIVVALCTAGITYLLEPLIDMLSGKTPRANPLFSFEEIAQNGQLVTFVILLLVGSYTGKAVGTYIQAYFMSYIGADIVRQIRNRMLDHMLSLEMAFFNKMRNGELMARITNDIGIISAAVSNYIAEFIRESVTIIALMCVVIYQSPKFAAIAIAVVFLAIIPLNMIIKKIKYYSRRIQEKNADITSKLNEIFSNVEAIKASNGEKLEADTFKSENLQFFKIGMKAVRTGLLTTPLMELLGAIMLGCVIYVATVDILDGSLSTAQFSSFVGALFFIFTPFKRLVNLYGGMQSAIVASDRIFKILNTKPQINDGNALLQAPIQSIQFNDVFFRYEDNIHALNGVSLDFRKNKITALVGKSGSGKSSIVNLVLRLYEANQGEVLVNGEDIKNYTQKSVRDNMAIVTQRIFIFHNSIAHNVAYGNEIDEQKVIDALKSAHAWEFVNNMPDGIHTILDEFGSNLSGGQRQRIAIARAIYRNPEVLILDEATSALDAQTEGAIKDTLNFLRKDRIIIIVAHRPSTIELADEVIHLQLGRIIKKETQNTLDSQA